jgi:hypothetical protein
MSAEMAPTLAFFTSPLGGEVGSRSDPGEGARDSRRPEPPHPNPLPPGERERASYRGET